MSTEENPQGARKKWLRQWAGAIAGAAIGFLLITFFPSLADRFSTFTVLIWCAVLGGVLTSLGDFMRAGAALTRSDNHWLNLAVGLGIPIIILTLFAALITILRR
jgi:protein-S-isoprenylcysteine O-methyltransferase Ste14